VPRTTGRERRCGVAAEVIVFGGNLEGEIFIARQRRLDLQVDVAADTARLIRG
jgi:hypothetical protein